MVINHEGAKEAAEKNIEHIINEIRIDAEADIIISKERSFDEILIENSSAADLILMGLAQPNENYADYFKSVQKRIKPLPTTILALPAQEVSLGEIE